MFQMKYNDNFTEEVIDIPQWKNEEDIPYTIKKYIETISSNRVIYAKDTKKYYCSKCVNELDENNYCKQCDRTYPKYLEEELIDENIDLFIIENIKELGTDYFEYLAFDFSNNNVYLYSIIEEVSYKGTLIPIPYRMRKLSINKYNSYLIEQDKATCLKNNHIIDYKTLDIMEQKLDTNEEFDMPDFNQYLDFNLNQIAAHLYLDNLNELENTIYKYSKLWKLKDYLSTKNKFTIAQLTYFPLYLKSFEYLINYKLYNLAFEVSNWFKKGKKFEEIFGIDKNYLDFMVKNNINWDEFKLFQVSLDTNIETLRYFKDSVYLDGFLDFLKETKLTLKELKKYFEKNNLPKDYITDYLDYLSMAKEQSLDLNDKNILYPKDFRQAHDELYEQIEITENEEINSKINAISHYLDLNKYEDDDYIIIPAKSIADLIKESKQQKNCVRTYCEAIADNKSQIYFLRKKEDITKSFVTIEVNDNKVVQARIKYNKLPDKKTSDLISNWEKNLIPIIID